MLLSSFVGKSPYINQVSASGEDGCEQGVELVRPDAPAWDFLRRHCARRLVLPPPIALIGDLEKTAGHFVVLKMGY
jgi:hypothetical protein